MKPELALLVTRMNGKWYHELVSEILHYTDYKLGVISISPPVQSPHSR